MIPNPWAILGAAGAVLVFIIGAYFYGCSHERVIWQAAVAKQQAEASQLLADRTGQVLAKEREAADLNAKLETTYAKAATDAADADARLRDALRVRRNASDRACRGNSVPAGASASGAENATGERGSGLAGTVDSLIADTARSANELAAYSRLCHDWVLTIGN